MKTPELTLCELGDAGLPRHETHSPFCMKVHRALRLAGLTYRRRHAAAPDAHRALNPARQVPVLLVGDEAVWDSTKIVTRVDELSGGALSRGLDARGRAEALLWEEMADTALGGFLVAARWADDDNWKRTRAAYFAAMPAVLRAVIPERIRARVVKGLHARDVTRPDLGTCWARLETTLDALEARAPSAGFWLGGDSPTRADIGLFSQLHGLRTPLTPVQSERVERRARLSAYLDRVDAASSRAVPSTGPALESVAAAAVLAATFG
ncbi:MAG TPA: glutathione S-transferase family protein [Polyangiaceae bacterium]|nr:glutathione S-transferase family protein [Polyangiaceae bacterium]